MAKRIESLELTELIECFKAVRDPRVRGRSKHLLVDILFLSVCAMLCGAEGIGDIEAFCAAKKDWLQRYLRLPNGIPSYDTIARVLSIVDVTSLERAFLQWVEGMIAQSGRSFSHISIDGKSSSGTKQGRSQKVLQMVSVYSHDLGLSLVETEGSKEGGEVQATLECLEMLDLKGVLVQVDAGIGCHEVVEKIEQRGGDYIVPLKGNRSRYRDEAREWLEKNEVQRAATDDVQRGRGEHRECALLSAKVVSEEFRKAWPSPKTIFSITRGRLEEDKRTQSREEIRYSEQVTYYVSSRALTASEALREVRAHWGIENKVHWVLDVAFREDECGVRAKKLARTLSLVRKVALNIIRRSKTEGSVRVRMKKAAWSNEFLEKLLFSNSI